MTFEHIGLVGISDLEDLADKCDLVNLVDNYYPVDLVYLLDRVNDIWSILPSFKTVNMVDLVDDYCRINLIDIVDLVGLSS